MSMLVLSGTAQPALAAAVCKTLQAPSVARTVERFPDGETRVLLEEPVRGAEVFIVQPLSPPADASLFELLLLADASRRAGAARVVAVMPYLAWARQDRRRSDGEPHSARLAADLISSRVDLAVSVDVHGAAAEGFFSVPFEHLTAIPTLAAAVSGRVTDPVVVAPDLGAAKRAEAFAAVLGAPAAYIHKTRTSALDVRARLVSGDVAGRSPIIVDDMISTGATIEAAVSVVRAAGCRPEIAVVATHALLVGDSAERLARVGLSRVVVSDSVRPTPGGIEAEVVSLAPLLGDALRRIHDGGVLTPLRARM